MSATLIIKVQLPVETVERLDAMALDIGRKLYRRVPRAAVIRAILHLLADKLDLVDVPGLVGLFDLDRVRRGRAPGPRGGAT